LRQCPQLIEPPPTAGRIANLQQVLQKGALEPGTSLRPGLCPARFYVKRSRSCATG